MLIRAGTHDAAQRTNAHQQRAIELAEQAVATAHTLGMQPLLAKASTLLNRLPSQLGGTIVSSSAQRGDLADRDTSTQPPSIDCREAVFRRDGEYWTLGYEGKVCQFKDSKGLSYIAYLIRYPGESIHATALVQAGGPPAATAAARSGEDTNLRADLGDAGEVLDAQARATYKRRLMELREELQEAEEFHDIGRAERLRIEIDSLAQALRRAVGFGSRARRTGSHTERARINVTRAVWTTMKRIAEHHPALAQHLGETIKTGSFCSYQPGGKSLQWDV